MFGLGKKTSNNLLLKKNEQDQLVKQVNRIIGQLDKIREEVLLNNVSDETMLQILAARGGTNKLATDLVAFGLLNTLKKKKSVEVSKAVSNFLKAV